MAVTFWGSCFTFTLIIICFLFYMAIGLFIFVTIPVPVDNSSPIIATTLGPLEGLRIKRLGYSVDAFLGIPYAKPPINELRFKKTKPLEPWEDVLKVVSQPPACPQFRPNYIEVPWFDYDTITEDEDCLYLNIWAPSDKNFSRTRPVLVWIYGGGFVSGKA